jgi:hypothetical protein
MRRAKPRAITRCVANTYSSPDERIIEVSFPARDRRTGTGAPGALIRLHNRRGDGPGVRPYIQVYRTDGEVDVFSEQDSGALDKIAAALSAGTHDYDCEFVDDIIAIVRATGREVKSA